MNTSSETPAPAAPSAAERDVKKSNHLAPDPSRDRALLKRALIERELGGIDLPPSLAAFLEGAVDVWETDGRATLRVRGENGVHRLNANADPLSVRELLAEIGLNLRPAAPASSPSNGAAPVPARTGTPSTWTEDERRAFIAREGHTAYRRALAEEAAQRAADLQAEQLARARARISDRF